MKSFSDQRIHHHCSEIEKDRVEMFLNNDVLLLWGNLRFQSHLTPHPMSPQTAAVTLEAETKSEGS